MNNTKEQGRFSRSLEMTKSAFRVLKLDKELVLLPLMSFAVSAAIFVPWLVYSIVTEVNLGQSAAWSTTEQPTSWTFYVVLLLIGFVLTVIANFFAGAVSHGAYTRFNGGDPSIRSSIAAAKSRFRQLVAYSAVAATVGFVLSVIEERVPFAGKVATWLVDAAWSIATVFAVPIIVLSENPGGPVQSIKQSAGLIKKVWGESIIVGFGVSLIGFLVASTYLLTFGVVTALIMGMLGSVNSVVAVITWITVLLGLFMILLTFSALGAIAQTAVYFYATTGKSPAQFNKELLKCAFTHQKARKLFGSS